jgi:hydrogenase maturation factor HypE
VRDFVEIDVQLVGEMNRERAGSAGGTVRETAVSHGWFKIMQPPRSG